MRQLGEKNRARLCVVVHGAYPVGRPRAVRQARAAVDGGYEVDVVALRLPREPGCEQIDGVRVYRLPLSHRRGMGILAALLEYVSFAMLAAIFVAFLALRRRYSAVVVHNPPDFLIAAGLLPKRLGSRLILDVQDRSRDMFEMRFRARRGASVIDRALAVIERRALRLADAVVTVHEPYRRELIRQGAPAGFTHVVMNSVDEGLLPSARHSRERGTFRIVYHGSLTPAYGVGVLIQAAAQLEGDVLAWRLDIYGDGDCLPSLLEQADRLAVSERVFFSRGYLPHREVLQHVAGASVAVIPNLDIKLNQFALPTKLFEYVALRIPVVAAALPTICEYFGANELFLFKPGDEHELAETLFAVARDPRQAAERAERAFVRYQQYRWPVNAARYRAVVNHQCREEHPPVVTAPDRQHR